MKKVFLVVLLGVMCFVFANSVRAAFVLTEYTTWSSKDAKVSLVSSEKMPIKYNALFDIDEVSGTNEMKITIQHKVLVAIWKTAGENLASISKTGRRKYPIVASDSLKTKFIFTKVNSSGSISGYGGYQY
ncbi:MAG: hypothetical protein Q4C38_01360 [bacterium]|nr:hypothetical protein [bacterium]